MLITSKMKEIGPIRLGSIATHGEPTASFLISYHHNPDGGVSSCGDPDTIKRHHAEMELGLAFYERLRNTAHIPPKWDVLAAVDINYIGMCNPFNVVDPDVLLIRYTPLVGMPPSPGVPTHQIERLSTTDPEFRTLVDKYISTYGEYDCTPSEDDL